MKINIIEMFNLAGCQYGHTNRSSAPIKAPAP